MTLQAGELRKAEVPCDHRSTWPRQCFMEKGPSGQGQPCLCARLPMLIPYPQPSCCPGPASGHEVNKDAFSPWQQHSWVLTEHGLSVVSTLGAWGARKRAEPGPVG
jgi:hypothetical protein